MKTKAFRQGAVLVGCVVVLVVLCFLSVGTPMHFDHERQAREAVVKARLVSIRTAEERYRQRHGVYASSLRRLVGERLLADSLRFIPYTDGEEFHLEATTLSGHSGRPMPVMECSALYSQYLQGLDSRSVTQLTEQAQGEGRFAGLKIGDLETDNNNAGNWE